MVSSVVDRLFSVLRQNGFKFNLERCILDPARLRGNGVWKEAKGVETLKNTSEQKL